MGVEWKEEGEPPKILKGFWKNSSEFIDATILVRNLSLYKKHSLTPFQYVDQVEGNLSWKAIPSH